MQQQGAMEGDATLAGDPESCLNCGAQIRDVYCPSCGQEAALRLSSVPRLVRRAAADFLDVDGRTWSTLRRLLLRPGELTRDYRAGRFRGQVAPIRLYVLASAAYFVAAPFLGGGVVELEGPGGSTLDFTFGPLTWDSEFLLLLLVPLWAAALWVVLIRQKRFLEEVFVFSVHYHVFFLLWLVTIAAATSILRFVGAPSLAVWLLPLSMVIPFVHLLQALRSAFGLRGLSRIVTATGLFLGQLIVGQLLFNLIETGRLTP